MPIVVTTDTRSMQTHYTPLSYPAGYGVFFLSLAGSGKIGVNAYINVMKDIKWYAILGFAILECVAIAGALPIVPKEVYVPSSVGSSGIDWGPFWSTVHIALWSYIPILVSFLVIAGALTFFFLRHKSLKAQILSVIVVVDILFLTAWGIMTFA